MTLDKEKALAHLKSRVDAIKTGSDGECWLPKNKSRAISRKLYGTVPAEIRRYTQLSYWIATDKLPQQWTYPLCGESSCLNPEHMTSSCKRFAVWLDAASKQRWRHQSTQRIDSSTKVNRQDFWAMDRAGIVRWDMHAIHPVVIKNDIPYIVRII